MSIFSALYPPLTAFGAFGAGLGVTAHNLANVQTAGFKPGRVSYADLPNRGGVYPTVDTPPRAEAAPNPNMPWGLEQALNPSGTDIATEMVNLITHRRAYQANAKMVDTVNQMSGYIINLKV